MSVAMRLDAAAAGEWFGAMPPAQRLRSLAPDFARADTQRAPGLDCVHVGYEEAGERWLHTFHRRAIAGGPAAAAISAYGYGSPCSTSDDGVFLGKAWRAWQAWAREQAIAGEFCRFHPESPHHAFFGGEVRFNRDTVSIDLTLDDVSSQFNTLARRKLRRCEGVAVRWSREAADWRRFAGFYRDAMAAMGAHERYHFGNDYFDAFAALPDIALCICAEEKDEGTWLSAGVYLFQLPTAQRAATDTPQRATTDTPQGATPDTPQGATPDTPQGATPDTPQGAATSTPHGAAPDTPQGVAEYHLGASSAAGHERGTAYLLQHAAALEAKRLGHASLYLGGGTTPAPDNPLLFYKRCFSRRVRPYRIGVAVHDPALLASAAAVAGAQGYDPANPAAALPDLLFA